MPLKLLMCLYKEVKLSFTRNLNVSLVFRIFGENFLLFFFLLRKGKGGRPPSLGPSSCYTLAAGLNKKIL